MQAGDEPSLPACASAGWSLLVWGVFRGGAEESGGRNETRCSNVGLKQTSLSLASFLAFAAYRRDLPQYRAQCRYRVQCRYRGMGLEVGSAGFEPAKAEPLDLQSSPFDRSGNSPHVMVISVGIQISTHLNLPQERYRFDRFRATVFSRSGAASDQPPIGDAATESTPAAIVTAGGGCFRTPLPRSDERSVVTRLEPFRNSP